MPNPKASTFLARALAAAASLAAAAPLLAAPAFVPDDQPIGFVAQPRSTTLDVRSGNALVFQGDYEKQSWSGNLKVFHVDAGGKLDSEGDLWPGGAAPIISTQLWDKGRKIVTLKKDGSQIPFLWGSLDKTQQDFFNNDKEQKFVRGDRSNEAPNGSKLRVRRYVLGDIIRSRPVYVPGTVPMVYVGANDGMLHAINANTGAEVYAYVPSMLIPKLGQLAPLNASGYTHRHFVDASPRAKEVTIGGAPKRILVGGLGAGGRGLYALDITGDAAAVPASEAAAAGKIMWEITPDKIVVGNPKAVTATVTYGNLGHTYGEPIIGKANNGNDVIFMANGYMNTLKDPTVPGVTKTGTGTAVLFAINPANGAKLAEIDTGNGNTTTPNGLSSPTPVDINGDGKIDYLYAGDLNGNLWKFDVTSNNPASWTASLLFTASPAQSITGAPVVADHPRGGRIVAFGTGRVLMASDMTDNSVHYMYGIWDGAPGSTLLEQTLNAEEVYVDESDGTIRRVRTLSVAAPDWTTHRGWMVAMPAGERFVGDRLTLTNKRVYGATFNPTANLSGATKSPAEPIYENWEYQFNFLTGGGTTTPIYDLNGDQKFDAADLLADPGGTKLANERAPMARFLAPGVTSQPVVVTTSVAVQNLYAQNPDLPGLSIVLGDPGVSGGHFDADVYYPDKCDSVGVCSGFAKKVHNHEYDDKYGVTGVNMLNASNPGLNLSNASVSVKRTAPQTQFKVLLSHQFLNPAAEVRIGPGGAWAKVKDYGSPTPQAAQHNAQALLDSMPVYTYDTIGNLVFGLPLAAFQSKDWWNELGKPDIRAGLMPTKTGCVNGLSDGNVAGQAGPNGERHNGAFIVQLIRASTPASALEMVRSGKPEYGWRVKTSEYKKYMLALWTYFWHHPSGECYGDSDWVPDPPQDASGGTPGTPPPNTDDPRNGAFNAVGNNSGAQLCTGTLTKQTVTYDKATMTQTVVQTFSGGCTMTSVTANDGVGGVTITVTIRQPDGKTQVTVQKYTEFTVDDQNKPATATTGRISWRELIRE